MTIKTDRNGNITHSRPGIASTDIPANQQFRDMYDKIYGIRCIKHPAETVPCRKCSPPDNGVK